MDRLWIAHRGSVNVPRIVAAGGVTIDGERYTIDKPRARTRPLGLVGPGVDVEASADIAVVDLRVAFLARHTPAQAVTVAERVARALHTPSDRLQGAQVWAVDLCADLAAVTFTDADLDAIVTKLRGADTWRVRQRRAAGGFVVTGLAFGRESAIRMTIYNKSAELKHARAVERAAMEGNIWAARGWDGMGDVWRVEIQLRGRALTEYGLRNPAVLADRIDGVWQSLVTKGVRLVDRNSATRRERCQMDPRWKALQGATFAHASALPTERVRGLGDVPTTPTLVGLASAWLVHRGATRAEAEALIGAFLAHGRGTLDEIDAFRRQIDRAWERAGRQRAPSARPGPHKARTARKRAA